MKCGAAVVGALLLALPACRFGGSERLEPAAGPTGDASVAADVVAVDGDPTAAAPDASGDESTPELIDGGTNEVGGDADPEDSAAAGCGGPFTPAVCDPVCNRGCPALSRCDLAPEPRTGICIGIWISGEGAACWRTPTTDPCAPQLSCLEGRCRRLCYTDGDCRESGTSCCNIPVNVGEMKIASGFKACGPCSP